MAENPGKFYEKNKLDKKALLKELSKDIARKYGIKNEKVEKLIKSEALNSIEKLRSEIQKNENLKLLGEKEIEKLFFTLKGALEVIENISKLKIEVLKNKLENKFDVERFKEKLEEYLPQKLLDKAKNPKLIHEHILGIALGSANSIFTTTEALYKIGIGIFQFPYHLYLIISGKGKMKNFEKI